MIEKALKVSENGDFRVLGPCCTKAGFQHPGSITKPSSTNPKHQPSSVAQGSIQDEQTGIHQARWGTHPGSVRHAASFIRPPPSSSDSPIHRGNQSGDLSHVTSGAGILTEALEGVKEQVKKKSSTATDMKQRGNSVAKFFRRPDSKQCTNENLAIVGL